MSLKILLFALVVLMLVSAPSANAQPAGKVPRIGFLSPFSPVDTALSHQAFQQGLRDLGWVEGKNISIEYRYAEGRNDRFPELAIELVRLKVDVIVTTATAGAQAAKQSTTTIPIVMVIGGDPVGMGLVASLARSGGNVTGLTTLSSDLSGKRLELLKEVVPKISRVGVLYNTRGSGPVQMKEIEVAAKGLGLQVQSLEVQTPEDFEPAFSAMKRDRSNAFIPVSTAVIITYQKRIVDLAAKNHLPGIYHAREFAEAGGLMSYGPDFASLYHRAATYVDKILKGAKPADLPVEQPTKFELVINLKTADQIGLTIPQSVLYRADKVIK